MKYILIIITVIYSTSLFSQNRYWNDTRTEQLRQIISKAMQENKISLPDPSKRSEYIDCVTSKVTTEYPTDRKFNTPSPNKDQKFKEIYQDCLKEIFVISSNNDIVKADVLLEWSEMNTSALKNSLLKRFSKEFDVEASNDRLVDIVNCAIEKLKVTYPKGINFSKINVSQYQNNINQYVYDCFQSKINK